MVKFLDIRSACPCGMNTLAKLYKQMNVESEPFQNMISHLIRTGSLEVKTCEDMHGKY